MSSPLDPPLPQPIHVLVVEDDPEQAELVKECLALHGGFQVSWVDTLQNFWAMMAAEKVDIILMDYHLPDGTGLEALESLSARQEHIPLIMITGKGDEQTAVRAMQLGASDYMVKGTNYWKSLPDILKKAVATQQLKHALQQQLEHIRYQALLLNNVRDAVVVWDLEYRINYWNHEAERLFELPAGQILGKSVVDIYQQLFVPPPVFPLEEKTIPGDMERKLICGEEDRWVSSRISPLRDFEHYQQLIGYMDVIRDITYRKRMEEHIQNAQRQLAQSSQLAAIGDLAAGVAHHINNPLTTIIAEAQILLNTLSPDSSARESARAIEQAGWRVQKAVQQLLDFSRPSASQTQLVSINDSLDQAIQIMGDQIRGEGITLHKSLAKNLPPVKGNLQKLTALWVNLLILAKDGVAKQPHGQIWIWSSLKDTRTPQVIIHDNGQPIPPQDIQHIEETTFFKHMGGRGSGIEINICLEILRQHFAELKIESQPSQGTDFRVLFLSGG